MFYLEIGAQVRSVIFVSFKAYDEIESSKKSDFLIQKDLFSFIHEQHFLSYYA